MQSDANGIWSEAQAHLQKVLSKDVFDRWIRVIEARDLKQDVLQLCVANDYYQHWLEENYLPLIRNAVLMAADAPLKIVFNVDPSLQIDMKATAPSVKSRASAKPSRTPSVQALPLKPHYTFEQFVVGPSNNFAHAAALAVSKSPGHAYNPLFLYGGVGLGKTHLMQAIGHAAALSGVASKICYTTSETFLNDFVDSIQQNAQSQFRRKYRNVHLLLIDDIQFLAGKERLQEEFFHTFNVLHQGHTQIVITCDRPAAEIPGLEQRLVSRLEWGLVTELEPLDMETRMAILQAKQKSLGLTLSNEVILFLAQRIQSNVRPLEGALLRLATYASLMGKALDIDTVERLLREILDQERKPPLSMEDVQRAVAGHYDLRLSDMTSKHRHQAVAMPRQVAMFLCRAMTDASLPTIGNAFSRNHATVLHAVHTIENRMAADPSFRQSVQGIKDRIEKARR